MAVKIRLARAGAKKRPFYRIVVANANAPRDGEFLEKVGTYNPMLPREHAERLVVNVERVKHWLGVGAQPTDRVERMLGQLGVIPAPAIRETPQKSVPGKKMQDRAEAKQAKLDAAKAAAEEAAAS
jgi:small subunit ribosomal protein S16